MKTEQDLIFWVSSFYVLEDLMVRLDPEETSLSKTKLKKDICEARKNHSALLATVLFDILVKMSFGEARHASDRCSVEIPEIDPSMGRKEVYALAEQFSPKDSLPKLRDLFLECWVQPYGGSLWAVIAETAMKFGAIPDEIFIDHCVDLSHHGGLAFDKLETGFHVWHKRKYLDILDCKRKGSILETGLKLPVFYFAETLVNRARTLKIIDSMPEMIISNGNGYRSVRWGSRVLSDARVFERVLVKKDD